MTICTVVCTNDVFFTPDLATDGLPSLSAQVDSDRTAADHHAAEQLFAGDVLATRAAQGVGRRAKDFVHPR